MSIDSIGIHIGPLYLRFYGLFILTGIILATNVAVWMAKRDEKDSNHIWDGLIWALIPGLIGARLWFVFFPSSSLSQQGVDLQWHLEHFFDMSNGPLAIWNGGLGIFGGLLGGLVGMILYARKHNLPLYEWVDIAAVVAPIGQAIGRWGNFANQELYGDITTLPWGIKIDAVNRVSDFKDIAAYPVDSTLFHPIFLYESLWSAASFFVMFYIWLKLRDRLKAGDFVLMYTISYSVIRFLLEFLRIDVTLVSQINVSQTTTGLFGLAALVWLVWRHRGTSEEAGKM